MTPELKIDARFRQQQHRFDGELFEGRQNTNSFTISAAVTTARNPRAMLRTTRKPFLTV
jgi:primosomal protein N''